MPPKLDDAHRHAERRSARRSRPCPARRGTSCTPRSHASPSAPSVAPMQMLQRAPRRPRPARGAMPPSFGGTCAVEQHLEARAPQSRAPRRSVRSRFWKQPPVSATRALADAPRPPRRSRPTSALWKRAARRAARHAAPDVLEQGVGAAAPSRGSAGAPSRGDERERLRASRASRRVGRRLERHRRLALEGASSAQTPRSAATRVEEPPGARRHGRVQARLEHPREHRALVRSERRARARGPRARERLARRTLSKSNPRAARRGSRTAASPPGRRNGRRCATRVEAAGVAQEELPAPDRAVRPVARAVPGDAERAARRRRSRRGRTRGARGGAGRRRRACRARPAIPRPARREVVGVEVVRDGDGRAPRRAAGSRRSRARRRSAPPASRGRRCAG